MAQSILSVSFQSVLQVFLLMAVGIAFRRGQNIFKASWRKDTSLLIYQLTLPCLLLTRIAFSIDASNLTLVVLMLLTTVIYVAAAYCLSVLAVKFLVSSHLNGNFHEGHFHGANMICAGTLPYVILAALIRMHPWSSTQTSEEESSRVMLGAGYISLFIVAQQPVMWSIVYPMILRWKHRYNDQGVLLPEPSSDNDSEISASSSSVDVLSTFAHFFETLWTGLKNMINPPMIGVLTGLLFGFVHPVREIFVNSRGDAFFQNSLWSFWKTCSEVTIPLQLFLLGASLLDSEKPPATPSASSTFATSSPSSTLISVSSSPHSPSPTSPPPDDIVSGPIQDTSSSSLFYESSDKLSSLDVYGYSSVSDSVTASEDLIMDENGIISLQLTSIQKKSETTIFRSSSPGPTPSFSVFSISSSSAAKSNPSSNSTLNIRPSKALAAAKQQSPQNLNSSSSTLASTQHSSAAIPQVSFSSSSSSQIHLQPSLMTSLASFWFDIREAMSMCPWQISLCALLVRQVLMPVCGLFLAKLFLLTGLVHPSNQPFLMTLLLQSAMPSALNLSVMCSMTGSGERGMAALMITQYLAFLPSLTVWISVFIWWVGRQA